jgi:hypothetical protein
MSDRTLDELDPPAWGPATPDATGLVVRCHELRRKPVGDFTPGDLRVMIDQVVALGHLVPRALEVLEENPLVDGDRYRGDLIRSVLAVDPAYWEEHQDDWLAMHVIIDGILEAVGELGEPIERFRGLTQP